MTPVTKLVNIATSHSASLFVLAPQWILAAALALVASIKMIFDRNLTFAGSCRADQENNKDHGAANGPIMRPCNAAPVRLRSSGPTRRARCRRHWRRGKTYRRRARRDPDRPILVPTNS